MSSINATRRKTGREVLAQVQNLAGRVNAGATTAGVEWARSLCPVSNDPKPVHLVDTIHAEVNEQTGEATMIAGDPEQGVDYVREVEYGWYTVKGDHVPGRYFFAQGEEVGREEAKRLAETLKPQR